MSLEIGIGTNEGGGESGGDDVSGLADEYRRKCSLSRYVRIHARTKTSLVNEVLWYYTRLSFTGRGIAFVVVGVRVPRAIFAHRPARDPSLPPSPAVNLIPLSLSLEHQSDRDAL